MTDLFATTHRPYPPTAHPNIRIIADMMLGTPRQEMRNRMAAGEYRGCHGQYLAEAGLTPTRPKIGGSHEQ